MKSQGKLVIVKVILRSRVRVTKKKNLSLLKKKGKKEKRIGMQLLLQTHLLGAWYLGMEPSTPLAHSDRKERQIGG